MSNLESDGAGDEILANDLSVLLDQDVSVEIVAEKALGEARLFVTKMKYEYFVDGRVKRFVQSAVVLEDKQLALPKFSVQPRIGGIAGKALRAIIGEGFSVELKHSSDFNETYWLHALNRDAIEVLFPKELCQKICADKGWVFAGNGPRLVAYKRNEVFHDQELGQFVDSALNLLALFQEGEENLDERPDLDRQVRASDASALASEMNGFVGSMIEGQLRRMAVSTNELESFVASAPPRTIPRGMVRQLVGDTLPLVFVGIAFMLFGLGMGIGWMFSVDGKEKLIGLVFLLTFPVIGFCMSFFTWRSRRRKKRTLRDGFVSRGYVRDVKRTGTEINNQRQYRVTIEYDYQGSRRTSYTNQLGATVERARYFKDSGKPARLLVHPEDPSIVICVDFVMVMN